MHDQSGASLSVLSWHIDTVAPGLAPAMQLAAQRVAHAALPPLPELAGAVPSAFVQQLAGAAAGSAFMLDLDCDHECWLAHWLIDAQHPGRGLVTLQMQNPGSYPSHSVAAANAWRHRLAVEEAQDGIALLDAQGLYTYVNKAHLQLFECRQASDLVGKHWQTIYGRLEARRLEKIIQTELEQNGRWKGETIGRTRTGKPVFQEVALSLLPDNSMVCICRDIADKRQKTMELQKLAAIASHSSSAVLLVNSQGVIEWVNPAFKVLTGYDLEEVLGCDPIEIITCEQTSAEATAQFAQAIQQRQPFQTEIAGCSRTGELFWLLLALSPVLDDKGRLEFFVVVQSNISLIKKAEADINQALLKEKQLSQLKSQFVSLASHELRTPLAVLQANLDLIEMHLQGHKELHNTCQVYLERISSEIERLSQIMNKILLAGNLENNQIKLALRHVWLHEVVKQLIIRMQQTEKADIRLDVQGTPVEVEVDRDLIEQVIANLISNALKYGRDSGLPVEVLVEYEGAFVDCRVKDYGIGIPEDDQQSLFNPFYRASNARHIKGIGLGLVLAKHLAELHGGSLSFNSQAGRYTQFVLQLPLHKIETMKLPVNRATTSK